MMIEKIKSAILLLACISLANFSLAQSKLPMDEGLKYGKLENGLTYYIRHNEKPEDRAELRLVLKAGSILETDAQQGLAHFVEHMAFNGTENFNKNELIDFLERSGVRFGAHLNAYTSFDETVYMLSLPTDSMDVFTKGFQVLEDWAHNVSFEEEEIDKERGVIVEERRLRLGSRQRIQEQTLPVLLYNSRYPERLPIGKLEILKSFPYERLKKFYKDWYRPDLMAVIAVGDFDVEKVEGLIQKHFSGIRNPKIEKERKIYPIPSHKETQVAIVTDEEARYTQLAIYYKKPQLVIKSGEDYVESLKRSLYNRMLNSRINEIQWQSDAPFLNANSSISGLIGNKDSYVVSVVPKEGKIEEALEAVLKENIRVRRFGFTSTELSRARADVLNNYKNAYAERTKRHNATFVREYKAHFLDGEAIPGIEFEYKFVKEYLDGISVADLNALAKKLVTEDNRVLILTAPEEKKDKLPTEKELLTIISDAPSMKVTAYEDIMTDEPLFSKALSLVNITSEKKFDDIGVTKLILANGVEVFLKPTDFKNEQVLFGAYSPGGTSLYTDADYLEASRASYILSRSGVAGFEDEALRKMLSGKSVSVYPYISRFNEGLRGSANVDDLETLLQLTHLYFTAPRFDEEALKVWQQNQKTYIKNKYKSPQAVYMDTLRNLINNYAARYIPYEISNIDAIDFERMQQIYKERFANAGSFAFFFVGSFDLDKIKPKVQKYLGNLSIDGPKENWKDLGIGPAAGMISKSVYKGKEPKSQVTLLYTGKADYSRLSEAQLDALGEVLNLKLRESLREETGGVYGVSVNTEMSKIPTGRYSLSISFGCAPENVSGLILLAGQEMKKLKMEGAWEEDLEKVIAIKRREHETRVEQNGYWMSLLTNSYKLNENPAEVFKSYHGIMSSLTPENLKNLAQKYFKGDNVIKVVLYPEEVNLAK